MPSSTGSRTARRIRLRGHGVVRGDRVTLACGNSLEYVVAAFGVLKAGGVLNPINPTLGAAELAYIVGHAEPRVLVADAASTPRVEALGVPITAAETLAGDGSDGPPDVVLGPDDLSTLLYTSGTTGRPKGVLFTHGRSGTSGPQFIDALGLRAGRRHPRRHAALPRQRLGSGRHRAARGRHRGVPEELLGVGVLGPGARDPRDGAVHAGHGAGHAADA